jgi:hypothetical protein
MISMLFKWLKKKEAMKKDAPESHFPIKVLIDPDTENEVLQVAPKAPLGADSNRSVIPCEPEESDFSANHIPYSRCGFNTCNELLSSDSVSNRLADNKEARDNERLRNEILNSDNLEECLKMIEKQSSRRPDRTALCSSEPYVEPKMAETCDKYTIWGNKISE